MNTDTIEIDGYTVTIAQDPNPENPFTAWDCEPPLLVYYPVRGGTLTRYNDAPETLGQIVRLLPDSTFTRGARVALLRECKISLEQFATYKREWNCNNREAFASLLAEEWNRPSGWSNAQEWFELAESLLTKAGIPCHYTQSNGYSQGDSVLLMAIALPAWCEKVGCNPEHQASQCEAACTLYGQWAWGDVYGIASITDPDGEELDDGSVWGFYGSDHKESGLLDSARDTIAMHKHSSLKEIRARHEAACRDIVTVP